MVHTESAKLMSIEEMKQLMDEDLINPTIDRMVFLETKKKNDRPGKLFPMFLEAYTYDDVNPVLAHASVIFKAMIVQSGTGEFGAVRVMIRESDLGETKRIWDKPPTKGLRNDTKWPGDENEELVQ